MAGRWVYTLLCTGLRDITRNSRDSQFFFVDVFPTLFTMDPLAILHHVLAILGYGKILLAPLSPASQARLACALLVTEASTPLLFAWKRAKLDASRLEFPVFAL